MTSGSRRAQRASDDTVTESIGTDSCSCYARSLGGPRKPYANLFWFTGSAWNVHPHAVPQLVQQIADTFRELQEFRFIQARLELEGVGTAIER